MTAKTNVIPTYTHTGYRPHTGYRHMGKLANHYDAQPGKRHACNACAGDYRALCGEFVQGVYDSFDGDFCNEVGLGRFSTVEESTAKDGSDVTCARCRKLLRCQRWGVQCVANYTGRWTFVKDHKYSTKSEAEAAMRELAIQYPGNSWRVRMK